MKPTVDSKQEKVPVSVDGILIRERNGMDGERVLCEECKWFDDKMNECHKNPPIAIFIGQSAITGAYDLRTFWPQVTTADWCGRSNHDWDDW